MLALAERFVPAARDGRELSGDEARRMRTGIVISWLGVLCTTSTAALYAYLGSPWSGAAILTITPLLLSVHLLIRRGASLLLIGNAATALTWLVTFAVGARTGGFSSPAVAWSFFHPITTYVACGKRSAFIWSGLSALQILAFYAAERLGLQAAQDLAGDTSNVLRVSGLIGCLLTHVALVASIEEVRVASQEALDRANRTIERQRILADMHDGIGSQLLGLMIQVRAKSIGEARLLQGLESTLDDLKLIVASLDPMGSSLDVGAAELRARLEPRCAAAGVALAWRMEPAATTIDPDKSLQVLRALQEMTTNALRHAQTPKIEVLLANVGETPGSYEVAVRDFGVGFDPLQPRQGGRGMTNLKIRARRLGGTLTVERSTPGMRVALRFPA